MQLGLSAAEAGFKLFMEDLILYGLVQASSHDSMKISKGKWGFTSLGMGSDKQSELAESIARDVDPGQPDLSVLIIIANCHMIWFKIWKFHSSSFAPVNIFG